MKDVLGGAGGRPRLSRNASLNRPRSSRCKIALDLVGFGANIEDTCTAWETGSQAKAGIGRWINFYNHQLPPAAHGGRPPAVVYFSGIETDQQARKVA